MVSYILLKVLQQSNRWHIYYRKYEKDIPVTDRGGPSVYETSRLPHFLDSLLTDGGEVFGFTRPATIYPRLVLCFRKSMHEIIVRKHNGYSAVSDGLWRKKCETVRAYWREFVTLSVETECLRN
jgi:hypothetical protein